MAKKATLKPRTSSDLTSEIESIEAKREGLIEDRRNIASRITSLHVEVKELKSQSRHDPGAALKLDSTQRDLESAQASEKSIAEEIEQVDVALRTLRADHRAALIAETEAVRVDAMRAYLESKLGSLEAYQKAAVLGRDANHYQRELFRYETQLIELGAKVERFDLPMQSDDTRRKWISARLQELDHAGLNGGSPADG